MQITLEILPRKTIIHVDSSIEAFKKIAPTLIFTAQKERERLTEPARMDSLFKDWQNENTPF